MLVLVQVNHERAFDPLERGHDPKVRLALELHATGERGTGMHEEPALHELEDLPGFADHVREDPVEFGKFRGIQAEGIALPKAHAGKGEDLGRELGPVNAGDLGAQPGNDPGPAAGARAQIDARVAGTGSTPESREDFPKLEVGAGGRGVAVLFEGHFALGEGLRAMGGRQELVFSDQREGAESLGRHRVVRKTERREFLNSHFTRDELGAGTVKVRIQIPSETEGFELFDRIGHGGEFNAFDGAPDVSRPNGFASETVDQDELAVELHLFGFDPGEFELGLEVFEETGKCEVALDGAHEELPGAGPRLTLSFAYLLLLAARRLPGGCGCLFSCVGAIGLGFLLGLRLLIGFRGFVAHFFVVPFGLVLRRYCA